ncbi:MAG: Fic family protein [Prevotella sp.]|uniref:Fic family protein n=1 Tax=Prevotella sp. TaxID=59823 RepID=UPI002A2CAE6E|nr:Fic family protein [Prevotella sp.]MDD7317911.1 Fic family protein [Prevotellaceae bacterium]MDY4020802.1 Fic family protein [Prevotella sp.]
MATVAERLAESLEQLKKLQDTDNFVVLHGTEQLSRVHMKRLLGEGWLKEVVKGWYIASRPGMEGDTTDWYTSYWTFISKYCTSRFGDGWSLTAEQSLDLHSGNTIVPVQTIIRTPKGSNNATPLLYGTSLFSLKAKLPSSSYIHPEYGVRMYSLTEALVFASPAYFYQNSISARTCLQMVKDETDIYGILADEGASTRAGRMAGAFRNIRRDKIADNILEKMRRLGYDIREEDPFEDKVEDISPIPISPHVARLSLMWSNMRQVVIDNFPVPNDVPKDIDKFFKQLDDKYIEDAYHSLSIEGYRVSDELIEKVKSGNWHPMNDDRDAYNALIARGYYQSFQTVKETIGRILKGKDAGTAVEDDHGNWYFEMWQPMVTAGLYKPSAIVGYRNRAVYIRGSRHTPMNYEAVRDAMPEYFRLLREEKHPAVRAILGHFLFGFIHPYNDGNGRMSRFVMNTMLSTGGYSWTVIPVERRSSYMQALEKAGVEGDVTDFVKLIAGLLE